VKNIKEYVLGPGH